MASGKRTGKALIWIGLGLILIGIAPIASATLASLIAENAGCVLNEGGPQTCIIAGSDWGNALYTMFVAIWFFLLTMLLIPVGLIVLIVGGVVFWRTRGAAPIQP